MFKRTKYVIKDLFSNTKIGASIRERKLKKMKEERLKKEFLEKLKKEK
jgi:hypothetical protein